MFLRRILLVAIIAGFVFSATGLCDGKSKAPLAPLEKKIVTLASAYLPKLDWPIRTGILVADDRAVGQPER